MIAGVPYDAEVEYLESTGTQWINTGVDFLANVGVLFDALNLDLSYGVYNAICGYASDDGERNRECYSDGGSVFIENCDGQGTDDVINLYFPSQRLVGGINFKNSGYLTARQRSEEQRVRSSFWDVPLPIGMFCAFGETGARDMTSARIYAMQISRGESIVRDFIPVRRGNMGYMYDRVTRKLFGNQGTGAFGYGLDTATPVMGLHRYPQIGGEA